MLFKYHIIPALNDGKPVLKNRGFLSSWAYQGERELPISEQLHKMYEIGFISPDLIIMIDTPAEICYLRKKERKMKPTESFEQSIKEFKKTEKGYKKAINSAKELFPNTNIKIIDGNQPIEEISDKIWEISFPLFDSFFKKK